VGERVVADVYFDGSVIHRIGRTITTCGDTRPKIESGKASLRLAIMLAAFGIILLAPKTELYLSSAHPSGAQTASGELISSPPTPADYVVVTARDKRTNSFGCVARPSSHDRDDALALHTKDKIGLRG
jgi:hypothetical protein